MNIPTISLDLLARTCLITMQDQHLAQTLVSQVYSLSDNSILTFLDFN